MPADWRIHHWPLCSHHVFLSHCAEDRNGLVVPVDQRVRDVGVLAWIDERNYPPGRDPFEILREELLSCRHVVYFVTPNLLRQGRGWTGIEKGYADLIQQRLLFGAIEVCHIELPLFFVPQDDPLLVRSAYAAIRHKGVYCPPDADAVDWASDQILQFVYQEQSWASALAINYEGDPVMRSYFDDDDHLARRIKGIDPLPIP
ncbi:MAG: toll/interleukin-1 receptor domain-containing protein [Pirellulales bacterium]